MGAFAINNAEWRLREHLRLGGRLDDQVGRELIWKFATKVWKDPTVAPALRQHGVTIQELATMYLAILQNLMPEPWMNVGTPQPMLVPTQWFMEPHRIENLLNEVTRESAGKGRDAWLEALIAEGTELARMTKKVHDETYGPSKFQVIQAGGRRSSAGCAGAIVFVAILLTSAVWYVLR